MRNVTGQLIALLLLIPTLATAGQIVSSTPVTSPVRGTISPKGYVFSPNTGSTTFTVTPAAGYAIGSVSVDGAPLAASGLVPGGKTYAVPNKSVQQKVVASFVDAVPAGLSAKLVPQLSVAPGSSLLISGSASTVSIPVTVQNASYSWSVSPAGPTLSKTSGATDSAAGLSTTFTSAAGGVYTVTLTLSAPGMNSSSATSTVVIATNAITQSKACSDCHAVSYGSGYRYLDYAGSLHATNPYHAVTCQSCHNPDMSLAHPGVAKGTGALENVCIDCHKPYNVQVTNYLKSNHNPANQVPAGFHPVYCASCHNPHSTVATIADDKTDSCAACHVDARAFGAGNYSIYTSASRFVMKRNHGYPVNFQKVINVGSTTNGWYKGSRYVYVTYSTVYLSPTDRCANCHGHNNIVNGEYKENYHNGTVAGSSGGRWKSSSSRAWKYQGYSTAVTPAQVSTDGCVRCHSTEGYINYVTSNYSDLRAWGYREAGYVNAATAAAASNTNRTTTAVTCRACHTDAEGTVRPLPAVTAFFNVTTVKYGKISNGPVQYSDFKNSNVCVACHSGRNGASNGPIFDTLKTFASYTSAGFVNAGVPHGDNGQQAGLLDAKLGYKFGATYTNGNNSHATIGVPGGDVVTNSTSGPCVTCHMDNASGHRKHTFDITTVPSVCQNCHIDLTTAKIEEAKAAFAASLKALAEIMINEKLNFTGSPILSANPAANAAVNTGFSYGNYSGKGSVGTSKVRPGANSAGFRYGFSGNPAQFAKVAGAIYNLKLLNQYDNGAFAHNPGYAKWLVASSINAVRATTAGIGGVTVATTSAEDAIGRVTPNARISAAEIALAQEYVKADGHYGQGTYKVQYVLTNGTDSNSCSTCHNPSESTLQAEARVAWSKSGHGETTAAPWMPAANHLWRNAGSSANFQTAIPANDCVRCHTAAGAAQFLTSSFSNVNPVATAAEATTNSPLNCNTCHAKPLDADSSRLTVPAVTTFYNISTVDKVTKLTVKARTQVRFPDVGESNICISCHSARLGGATLVQAAANGLSLNNSGFQNSHYMAASGTMYMKAGFINFTTLSAAIGTSTYQKTLMPDSASTPDGITGGVTSTHRKLGTTAIRNDSHNPSFFVAGNLDTNGPCVTCHLKGYTVADTDRPGAGHSLQIDQATITQVCNKCHSSEGGIDITTIDNFQKHFLEPQAEVFQNALTLAKTLLLNRYQISYNPASYPYFYDQTKGGAAVTDWTRGGALTQASALKLEGACFNLNLLSRDPAAYAHARTYTRRLVYDSIDFLDDGVINLSVGATALAQSAIAGSPVSGLYGKGEKAYTDGTLTTLAPNTTESMVYLIGWSRTNGSWNTPERP